MERLIKLATDVQVLQILEKTNTVGPLIMRWQISDINLRQEIEKVLMTRLKGPAIDYLNMMINDTSSVRNDDLVENLYKPLLQKINPSTFQRFRKFLEDLLTNSENNKAKELKTGDFVSKSTSLTPPQSSSPVVDSDQRPVVSGQKSAKYEIRDTNDKVGGIDMNSIDLDKQGAGVDIQFNPADLQELIDAGIDGFAPVIINITPLPSVLPLLGLDQANKEEHLEVSSLN